MVSRSKGRVIPSLGLRPTKRPIGHHMRTPIRLRSPTMTVIPTVATRSGEPALSQAEGNLQLFSFRRQLRHATWARNWSFAGSVLAAHYRPLRHNKTNPQCCRPSSNSCRGIPTVQDPRACARGLALNRSGRRLCQNTGYRKTADTIHAVLTKSQSN